MALTDDTLTMAPEPWARMMGSTSRARRNGPKKLASKIARASSSLVSSMGA